MLDTNLTGGYRGDYLVPARGWCGRLISISSMIGLLGSGGHYAASEVGLVGMAHLPGSSSRATLPPTWWRPGSWIPT